MKYIDEYRDPAKVKSLLREIESITTRPWTLMEIFGGQTHAFLHHSDRKAAEHVYQRYEYRRNRVSPHELTGAIHRPIEIGFLLDLTATLAGLFLV